MKGSSKIVTKSQRRLDALSSQRSHVETVSLGTGEPNDSNISHTLSKTTSNWRLKGKRNSRSRKTGIDDETETRARKSRSITEIHLAEFSGWSMNGHHKESSSMEQAAGDLSHRLRPFRQSRFTVNPKYESSGFPIRHNVNMSGLYEVNIEVKSSRRPRGVPYISLMSKLNGRPVTGNPVEIEVLENGFCDSLLSPPQHYSSSPDNKVPAKRGKRGQPPATPGPLVTKRGTRGRPPAMSGPLVNKMGTRGQPPAMPGKLLTKRGTRVQPQAMPGLLVTKRGTRGQLPVTPGPLLTKRGTVRKNNYPQFRKSAKPGLSTKKTKTGLLMKKTKTGLLMKKTKTGLLTKNMKTGLLSKKAKTGLLMKRMRKFNSLSRLTANGEGEKEKKLITENDNPVIACVPLKVVFSRINADLSRSMHCPAPC